MDHTHDMEAPPKVTDGATSRRRRILLTLLTASAILALAGVVALILSAPVKTRPFGDFGKIWQLYSFNPNVSATAYDSKNGKATIIWLSGMDESSFATASGQIWSVYSFATNVNATAYDSKPAGATIIWLSGMDNETNGHARVHKSIPPGHPIHRKKK